MDNEGGTADPNGSSITGNSGGGVFNPDGMVTGTGSVVSGNTPDDISKHPGARYLGVIDSQQ